ncbi:MAG: nucleoside deaminase [Planctomycetota bacterium]
MTDTDLMDAALEQAIKSYGEGGIPIGGVLYDPDADAIVSRGHNERVQSGDPTAHAEMMCVRNAGRRRDWPKLTLVSTLSPCIMCTGMALLFRIPRVLIGENRNFLGAEDLFADRGVDVAVMDHAGCVAIMEKFIAEQPDLWNEDIGV